MNYQRIILGIVAALMLIAGVAALYSSQPWAQSTAGILIRVGLTLGVIWLAWPEFKLLWKSGSLVMIGGVVGLLVVIAVRRQLFPFALALFVFVISVNGVLRKISSATGGGGRR